MPDAGPGPDPTIHRRRLRSELRRAREAAGFAQRDVAAAMDWSLSKLLRIETGAVGIATNDLRALLNHYNITDQERVRNLIEVARSARAPSPWTAYRDVSSPEFIAFLAYESAASIIRNFEPLLVPGMLQTEEYARTVLGAIRGPDARTVDRLVELRLARQEALERPEPPECHFIIEEAVIRRQVGGPAAMRRQLRAILEMSERPNVTVRILPFSAGIVPVLRGSYYHFEFEDPENDDVLFIEETEGDTVIRENAPPGSSPDPVEFLETFFALEQPARREETTDLLRHAIDDMTTHEDPPDNQSGG